MRIDSKKNLWEIEQPAPPGNARLSRYGPLYQTARRPVFPRPPSSNKVSFRLVLFLERAAVSSAIS